MDNHNFVQQGWQCPICKRVYSPFTMMCCYCGGDTVISTDPRSTGIDWQKHQSVTTAVYKPQEDNLTSISNGAATYTAEDKKTCIGCKHHNAGAGSLRSACRDCINYDRWESE